MSDQTDSSYKQILKSTGLVSGAQIIQIVLSVVKTKVVAIILGSTGMGISGMYQSIIDLVRNLTGLGIGVSGVRDIAEAKASGDPSRVSRSVGILYGWAFGTGLLGALAMILFCVPFSRLTFGSSEYALPIACLFSAVFLSSVSGAQTSMLQGMQRIADMALSSVIGAVASLGLCVPVYLLWGVSGIVPAIVLITLASTVVTTFFARRTGVRASRVPIREAFRGGLPMAKLGFFIVVNGFIATATMYVTKLLVAKRAGMGSVGIYQAAWNITTMYIGLVLNSMLADFFPRLSEKSMDDSETNRLVNEQGTVTLLLGMPLISVMYAFSPLVMRILYTGEFVVGVPILRAQLLGSFFTLLSWPVGVIFLTKGKGSLSMLQDLVGSFAFLALTYFLWSARGLSILGDAYAIRCAVTLVLTFLMARRVTGYRQSGKVRKLTAMCIVTVACFVAISCTLTGRWADVANGAVALVVSAVSLYALNGIMPLRGCFDWFSRRIGKK
jgi:enterobacterial common antigen flippase